MEERILTLRRIHGWCGRKIRSYLLGLGCEAVPSHTTVTAVYRRHGLIDTDHARPQRDYQRFEAPAPNVLWQMDFKGDFALSQGRCYPLTVLDDHSRFALGLFACADQQRPTVQGHLVNTFRRYGLPWRILADNGGPWGSCGYDRYTVLGLWLIRLGITLSHSRVCHPQTLGKDERFHRTLNYELLSRHYLADLTACQQRFDWWRNIYNCQRPHEALADDVPAHRYAPSPRPYPETLPSLPYEPSDTLRKVNANGRITFLGHLFKLGRAFIGTQVALRPATPDGTWNVYYYHQHVASFNLNTDTPRVTHV
jgi:transposase InsO family protein